MQFRIRTLMFAIAAVAGLLFTLRLGTGLLILLLLFLALCAMPSYGFWHAARGYKRLPPKVFLVVGTFINVLCFVASITCSPLLFIFVALLPCLIGTAITLGFGAAWCTGAAGERSLPGRGRSLRCAIVAAVSIAPITMLFTLWPFRLAFLVSRPSLERLADRVAAGAPVSTPVWAGPFRIVGSAVDPTTGGVGLITDPDPSGRKGFQRSGPSGGPFYNLFFDLQLTEKWKYADED